MAIADDFIVRFPRLVSAFNTHRYVLDIWSSYDKNLYQPDTKEQILNLIAHLVVVDSENGHGAAKDIQSQSMGRVSVSYGSSSASTVGAEFYKSTQYGQRYLYLASLRGSSVAV